MFQPSPNLKAGCNTLFPCHRTIPPCFNPHPTSRPGATMLRYSHPLYHHVSTLTQPQGRVQLPLTVRYLLFLLFQPSPNLKARCDLARKWYMISMCGFNPHPTSRPGATFIATFPIVKVILFQPSPNLKAGATSSFDIPNTSWTVSTLTQPQGRVNKLIQEYEQGDACFNPHPTSRPGATLPQRTLKSSGMFQPSPNLKAGCNNG